MHEGKPIKLTPAKGRPMLQWVGKRPLDRVTAFPAQLVERFAPLSDAQGEGLIFHGDNKDVLSWLLANGYRGKINLVYIDPPFDSGADYVRKVELRGQKSAVKVEGEHYTLGEQIQYTDIWTNDSYLQFLYERLLMLKELISEDGCLWLHCDWHKAHHLRMILDEVFGPENFRNEVIWFYPGREMHIENKFNAKHDSLLFIAKSESMKLNMKDVAIEYDHDERLKGLRRKVYKDEDGREWVWETRGQAAGQQAYKRYVDEILEDGKALNDVWDDIQFLRGNDPQREGFPTQKPESLLERIVLACSDHGDYVLDCFAGSGTTAAVAQKLGRRWIIADINKGAVQTASKRLQRIIQEQVKTRQANTQLALLPDDSKGEPPPAQLAFAIYRVNDYDLQIQHNEALNLAIEHVGIERLKGDPFFEGTLGKRLVKIIPFNHPLTRLDLQMIQDELKKRSNEDRDIVAVCLGKELAADAWLAEYNHRHPVNKISVIELRTDPRYGKFFEHQPASAEVHVIRKEEKIVVEIEDFISPTILERLEMDSGMFKAKITDWRAMVDTVLVDTAYDGQVFNVTLSDVPERKTDLVVGHYELPAPADATTVAVKIIDMLGEELLEIHDV
ncbi:MAG: site-specific DNA-methyltransferase [Anaerolineaceae bacterium]|nr:site-specific DNA-methyltransferase [Anaerolineaceae bacterium]